MARIRGNRGHFRRIFLPALSRLLCITLEKHWRYGTEREGRCLPTCGASSLEVVMISPTRLKWPFAAHPESAGASPPCLGRGTSADRAVLTPARPPPPSPLSSRHP